jgi:PHD/YefM family antitoxin component YafN of YafNO toxin-antitoxin module
LDARFGTMVSTEYSTERNPLMNTIPAQEIKRRGIAAVDDLIETGDVHIIRNNRPQYVVLSEARYRELIEAQDAAWTERVNSSLQDLKAGRVQRFTSVRELLHAIESGDEA